MPFPPNVSQKLTRTIKLDFGKPNAIDPFHADGGEDFCKLVSNRFGHDELSPSVDAGLFVV
jgi:hypothetical protein